MKTAETDFEVEDQNLKTEVATVTTREIVDMTSTVDNVFMPVTNIPPEYRVDSKPWTERPFFVDRLKFTTSDSRYSTLKNSVKYLPGDVARSNPTLLNVFKIAALGRPDLVLNISVAGTIGHAGCVLAAVLPPLPEYPGDARYYINTALSGPHAFLNANEATSVVLPVPWYCNTDMMTLDMDNEVSYTRAADLGTINGNYGTLVFIVLNPLSVSAGSTNEVNIIVEACFRNFDMVVPTPRYIKWVANAGELSISNSFDTIKVVKMTPQAGVLATIGSAIVPGLIGNAVSLGQKVTGDLLDRAGKALRKWTGLHNANEAIINQRIINTDVNFSNVVDTKQFFEKLDPHANSNRIVTEPIFGTMTDEMDLTHISSKDQYLGTFKVSSTDDMGARLWNKPISPFQGGLGISSGGLICVNNLELLHSLHRGWRGGLKLKIQSVMNNKQQVKLKVIKYYNPSVFALQRYPTYLSVVNAPAHLLEFTQGGQNLEVDLPFLSRNAIMPRGENPDFEAAMHGMYYIFLAQPLVTSDGSPAAVEFNVYMSGADDLQFYGYVTSNTYHAGFNYRPTLQSSSVKEGFTTLGIKDRFSYSMTNTAMASRTSLILERLSREYGLDKSYFADDNNLIIEDGIVIAIRTKEGMPSHTEDGESGVEAFNLQHVLKGTEGGKVGEIFQSQSAPLTVMNKPQEQHVNMNASRGDEPVEITRIMPTLNLRDIVRRMYKSEVVESLVKPRDHIVSVYSLGKYVSELPNTWGYTPISLVSRMYYGKTIGFKIRLVITAKSDDSTNVFPDDLNVRIFYQPQGVNVDRDNETIVRSTVNAAAYESPIATSLYGEPPFTYQVTPVKEAANNMIYEFVIPDTSYYKFMGSPEKFKDFSGTAKVVPLSTNDFGNLVVSFTNSSTSTIRASVETFIGLTDESRFGFHSIAPPFQLSKKYAFYKGTSTNPNGIIPDSLNPYAYFGGFI